jgi:carbon monoxide dehydrogenase subunit G
MDMTGSQLVPAPKDKVWAALNDPAVLKACITGCESMDRTDETTYQIVIALRVGPVTARFKGKIHLADLNPPESYMLRFEGQGGAAGFAKGEATVNLSDEGGATRLAYVVNAQIGGKLAQIGSRLVDGAAKKTADEFFVAFTERMRDEPVADTGAQGPGPRACPG